MTIRWTACRDARGDTLEQCRTEDTDLGRFEHVRKVLELTFRGLTWQGSVGQWADKHIQVEVEVPVVPRPSFIELRLEPRKDVSPEHYLGGRFRTLAQKRAWAVFDSVSQQRVAFPPARARRHGPLPPETLVPAQPAAIPRTSHHWIVVYVQALPGEYVSDILDFVTGLAHPLSGGRDFGVLEERACVQVASGERLYGVGFKREFVFVERALRSQPAPARLVATLENGTLLLRRGDHPLEVAGFTCLTY